MKRKKCGSFVRKSRSSVSVSPKSAIALCVGYSHGTKGRPNQLSPPPFLFLWGAPGSEQRVGGEGTAGEGRKRGRAKPSMLALDGWVVWMVGLVESLSLSFHLSPLATHPFLLSQGSACTLDRYVPLNQLRASLREHRRFTTPASLAPTPNTRQPPPFAPLWVAQTVCPPLPNGWRRRFLLFALATSYGEQIRAFHSIGFCIFIALRSRPK